MIVFFAMLVFGYHTNKQTAANRVLFANSIDSVRVVTDPEPADHSFLEIPVSDFPIEDNFLVVNPTSPTPQNIPPQPEDIEALPESGTSLYTGPIPHIFFHSLIIYPEQADSFSGYDDYMITRDQFNIILEQLYNQNYILIDSRILYSIKTDGTLAKKNLYLPEGKKPLVLSIDDLSYYNYMKNDGFANKLVLDGGKIKTEVITPEGETIITRDGDVVPIIDGFVEQHPDFSWQGAKGIIALTGYEGILGYDTHLDGERGEMEISLVKPIVQALKNTGWIFASHSYSHGASFRLGTISEDGLANDINNWSQGVGSIVGDTNIFIGPFGQIFQENNSRRSQLIEAGFPILYGVGLNHYLAYFNNHLVMDRIDIDGYRLKNNPNKLKSLLGLSVEEL